MKRREFIRISAFVSAAISVPLLNACNASSVKPGLSEPLFLSRLFNQAQLAEAGREYLRKIPGENSRGKLVDLLSGNGPVASSNDVSEIHRFLDQKVRDDFQAGNTVTVKGWVLSITEARQCALFSLMQA